MDLHTLWAPELEGKYEGSPALSRSPAGPPSDLWAGRQTQATTLSLGDETCVQTFILILRIEGSGSKQQSGWAKKSIPKDPYHPKGKLSINKRRIVRCPRWLKSPL